MADSDSGPESEISARQQTISSVHPPENIERHEEMKGGSLQIKSKCYVVIELRLVEGIGDNFRATAIVV